MSHGIGKCGREGRVDVGPRVCSHRRPTLIIVNCGIAVLQQQTSCCGGSPVPRKFRVHAHAPSVLGMSVLAAF